MDIGKFVTEEQAIAIKWLQKATLSPDSERMICLTGIWFAEGQAGSADGFRLHRVRPFESPVVGVYRIKEGRRVLSGSPAAWRKYRWEKLPQDYPNIDRAIANSTSNHPIVRGDAQDIPLQDEITYIEDFPFNTKYIRQALEMPTRSRIRYELFVWKPLPNCSASWSLALTSGAYYALVMGKRR